MWPTLRRQADNMEIELFLEIKNTFFYNKGNLEN